VRLQSMSSSYTCPYHILHHPLSWVAPHGTHKPLLGTNPFCVRIPTHGVPIIYDIGTSKIIHAQVLLAQRTGQPLPEDMAFDADGNVTTDPADAPDGALAIWGGAKGSGLAVAVQLLGILAGSPALPPNLAEFGFFVIAVDPARFRPIEEFKAQVGVLIEAFHGTEGADGMGALRMPFERSNRVRERTREEGSLDVDEVVLGKLRVLVNGE
jgi:delta1-piperideine-2-carboxylate reductase